MAALSGKNGKVRINGATLKVTEWAAHVKTQKLDQTNSESGGYGEYLGGVADADVTLRGNFEVATTPLTAYPPGAALANTVLYLDGTSGPQFDCTLFVETFRYTTPTRGLVTIEITGNSTGVFTFPNL